MKVGLLFSDDKLVVTGVLRSSYVVLPQETFRKVIDEVSGKKYLVVAILQVKFSITKTNCSESLKAGEKFKVILRVSNTHKISKIKNGREGNNLDFAGLLKKPSGGSDRILFFINRYSKIPPMLSSTTTRLVFFHIRYLKSSWISNIC